VNELDAVKEQDVLMRDKGGEDKRGGQNGADESGTYLSKVICPM